MKQQKGKASKKTILVVVSACGLVVILLFFWLLSSPKPWNPNDLQEGIPDSLLSRDFTLTLEDTVFSSKISELKMKLVNHTYEQRFTGADIIIEVQINEKWYRIPDNGKFTLIAVILEPDSTREFIVDVHEHFGKLPQGHYRCSKEIGEWAEATYASAEFDIT